MILRGEHLFARGLRPKKGDAPVSLELRPGMHAIVVDSMQAADALVRCMVGMTQPHRGSLRLGSAQVAGSPELRARIGSLLYDEPAIFGFPSVEKYVTHVLQVRKGATGTETPRPDELPFLQDLLPLGAATLSPHQRRLVALSLALQIPQPPLVALCDPLRDLDGELTSRVVQSMRERVEAGAILACLVPTERAAKLLSDSIHDVRTHKSPNQDVRHFLIHSERIREVAGRLAESSAVSSTRVRKGGDLVVGVESEEAGAAAITAAICACQVEVFEVRRVGASPPENEDRGTK